MTKAGFSSLGGATALNFANTRPQGHDGPVERLASFADVIRWCVEFGLLSSSGARAIATRNQPAALSEIHSLREQLRHGLQRQADGRADWRPLVKSLNAILANASGARTLQADARGFSLMFIPAIATPHDVLALIAAEIAHFMASGDLARSRRCGADDCLLWFVDRTRNHSRHWCSMAGCGDKAKARAFYHRKKQAAK